MDFRNWLMQVGINIRHRPKVLYQISGVWMKGSFNKLSRKKDLYGKILKLDSYYTQSKQSPPYWFKTSSKKT